ncbi:MAG TPA: tRNA pseudouridine(55) synthase TruB [Thermoanaerobaculia bacterium]|nr:tRNA pseudouridine(55) synthase TruB [Thermoanaerobaculia bacterium]
MSARAAGPDGVLLVDKPEKLTSHDVVDVTRRLLGTRRIGHTGTLDPAATGLLVLCVGRAGRLQSFLTGWDKTYEGTIVFGVATDTYDTEGTPAGEPHPDPAPSRARLEEACRAFTGEILQVPPPFSAKKIAGRKFYELARAGEPVPETPKAVTVRSLDILDLDGAVARFRVSCTSGTYIRSLAHDIGKALGTGAHLGSLRRISIGPFRLEEARTLLVLEALAPEERFGKPSWLTLSEIPLPFPAVALAPAEAAKVRSGHGVPVRVPEGAGGSSMVRLTESGELLALGTLEPLGRGALALARPKVVLAG